MAMILAMSEGNPQAGEQASIRIEGSDTWLPALVPVHAPRGSRTPTTSAVPVVGCFVHNSFVLSWADMRCRSTTGASFPAECDGADQRNVAVQDTASAISFVESLTQEGRRKLHGGGGGGCHPAGSYLTLEDGKSIAIEHAAVGTLVKAEIGFQPILGFLHAEEDLVAPYLRFTTPSASMAISSRHHAFVNGTETDPSFIELGDLLHTSQGLEPVTRIETLEARGAYHILVKGGSYYVDGILASDYYEAVSREIWPRVRDYVEARHSLGIPVIPKGRGVFPRHDWVSGLLVRAGVPLWARKTVLSPLIVASSILTELANVAVERFPTWLSTVVAVTVAAKLGYKLH